MLNNTGLTFLEMLVLSIKADRCQYVQKRSFTTSCTSYKQCACIWLITNGCTSKCLGTGWSEDIKFSTDIKLGQVKNERD